MTGGAAKAAGSHPPAIAHADGANTRHSQSRLESIA